MTVHACVSTGGCDTSPCLPQSTVFETKSDGIFDSRQVDVYLQHHGEVAHGAVDWYKTPSDNTYFYPTFDFLRPMTLLNLVLLLVCQESSTCVICCNSYCALHATPIGVVFR